MRKFRKNNSLMQTFGTFSFNKSTAEILKESDKEAWDEEPVKTESFNEKIWLLCKKVPKGKVTTYKLLAEAAGTKAYRAVGNAMNKNPYGLMSCGYGSNMVPCH